MQNEFQSSFNEYLTEFNKLDIESKHSEILSTLKELIDAIIEMANDNNIPLQYLQSELINKNNFTSEDEFLETLLVYIENAKNIVAQYITQEQ